MYGGCARVVAGMGPSTEIRTRPEAGSVERTSGAEEVQANAQAQVDETEHGKDLGESFGAVVGYWKHIFFLVRQDELHICIIVNIILDVKRFRAPYLYRRSFLKFEVVLAGSPGAGNFRIISGCYPISFWPGKEGELWPCYLPWAKLKFDPFSASRIFSPLATGPSGFMDKGCCSIRRDWR